MARKWMVLSLVLVLLLATACSGGNGGNGNGNDPAGENAANAPEANEQAENVPQDAEKPDPFGKYPELIEVTTIKPIGNNPKLPEGESYEDNTYNRFMMEQLNVKPKFVWMAPQDGNAYMKKLDLAIAANDIPEVFTLVATSLSDLQLKVKRLVDADMIEDLTEAYETYASPQIREAFESEDNRALDLFKIDGKLFALPEQTSLEGLQFVWVREDWRKKLNLPEPKTLDDVLAIAKAFKEQDPAGGGKTVPIAMQMQTESVGLFGPTFIFDQFEANPDLFYKNASGELVYGGTEPGVKETLKVLHQLYKDGLIEKDFALKDTGQLQELLASGRAGIVGQAWWGVWYPLFMTLQNAPDADWKPYAIPGKTNGKLNLGARTPVNAVVVVKKGFKYPELPIKWANVYNANRDSEFFVKTGQEIYKDANEKNPIWMGPNIMKTDEIPNQAKDIVAAVNGELDPATLPFKNQDAFKHIKSFIDELQHQPQAASKNMLQWQNTRSWYDAMGQAAKMELNVVYSAFDGRTPTMDKKMTALNEMRIKEYHRMIMSSNIDIDSAFDEFVQQWKKQGGDQILAEIKEQIGQ